MGPEPVSLWHLRDDFDAAIFDAQFPRGGEACGAHGIDDCSVCLAAVGGADALAGVGGGAGPVALQVEGVPVQQLVRGDVCAISRDGWDNVQARGGDVGIRGVGGRPVEGAVAEASDGDLMTPDGIVDGGELVVEDEAVLRGC